MSLTPEQLARLRSIVKTDNDARSTRVQMEDDQGRPLMENGSPVLLSLADGDRGTDEVRSKGDNRLPEKPYGGEGGIDVSALHGSLLMSLTPEQLARLRSIVKTDNDARSTRVQMEDDQGRPLINNGSPVYRNVDNGFLSTFERLNIIKCLADNGDAQAQLNWERILRDAKKQVAVDHNKVVKRWLELWGITPPPEI
jgi:hypothetical protein